MSFFQSDLSSLQNTALCGTTLWRFCGGYESEAGSNKGVPLPLAFIVLPITLNPISRAVLQSTQVDRGLIAFAAKFSTPPARVAKVVVDGIEVRHGRENLLALQARIVSLRSLTIRSLGLAVAKRLLFLNTYAGDITVTSHRGVPAVKEDEVREMLRTAYKFGCMTARHSVPEVCRILGVAL